MKHMLKIAATLLLLATFLTADAQESRGSWPTLPGLGPESPLTLTSEETFYGVMGAAALSYILSEYVGRDHPDLHFYQARIGANNEYFWGHRHVFLQNVGVENRVAPWFAFAAEANLQQWSERTPDVNADRFGFGLGLMTYYRWYIFGKKKVSPYLEYGTGLFYGASRFPYNGSNFTFNHSTQIGVEVTLPSEDRVRIGYGQFHQSNNGLVSRNPGYDANGFSISYSWRWWRAD